MSIIKNPLTVIKKSGGGEITGDGAHLVTVYDYDGTILKQERLDAGEICTMPTVPEHDRLVFQEWSSTKAMNSDGNSVTVENSDIAVGATYKTASGNTEFDVVLTKVTGLTVTLQNLTNKTSVIWGDGTTNTLSSHTYSNYGKYTIQVSGVTDITGRAIAGESSYSGNYACVEARIAESVLSSTSAFNGFGSLTSVSIPNSVASMDGDFSSCYSLKAIVIPNGVQSLGDSEFRFCYSLQTVVIANSVITLGESCLSYCSALRYLIIPDSITTIGEDICSRDFSLVKVKISKNITNIPGNMFYYCYSCKNYDFSDANSIPTISSSSIFSSINEIAQIIVPDSLYNQWVAATNWSTYADYIYRASEVTE